MKCIRCGKERGIPGFCGQCYDEIYGLSNIPVVIKQMDELIPNKKHLTLIERDYGYTDEIRQSIIKDGLKNALIIDNENRILIGHHRYYICKELGWERIGCYVIEDSGLYNKFIEGGLNNLFILKIDGKIVASVTNMNDFIPLIQGWILETPYWKTSHLVLEAFTGLGASNDEENWRARNRERCDRLGGKRNLSRDR